MTQSNNEDCNIFGQKLFKILVCYFVTVLKIPAAFAEVLQKFVKAILHMNVVPQ